MLPQILVVLVALMVHVMITEDLAGQMECRLVFIGGVAEQWIHHDVEQVVYHPRQQSF